MGVGLLDPTAEPIMLTLTKAYLWPNHWLQEKKLAPCMAGLRDDLKCLEMGKQLSDWLQLNKTKLNIKSDTTA